MRRGRKAFDAEGSLSPGRKVGVLRGALGWTQEEMAAALGVSRPTVASYENRANVSPSTKVLRAAAERHGIPLAWFYDGLHTEPPINTAGASVPGAIVAVDTLPARYALSSIERLTMFAEGVGSMAAHRAQDLLGRTEGEVTITVTIEVKP